MVSNTDEIFRGKQTPIDFVLNVAHAVPRILLALFAICVMKEFELKYCSSFILPLTKLLVVVFFFCYNSEEATTALSYGREQLEVLKRQSILGRLYPSGRSVMES